MANDVTPMPDIAGSPRMVFGPSGGWCSGSFVRRRIAAATIRGWVGVAVSACQREAGHRSFFVEGAVTFHAGVGRVFPAVACIGFACRREGAIVRMKRLGNG